LTGEARSQALEQGLAAALAIGNERYRVEVLAAFLPVAPDPAALLRSARQAAADHLLKNLSTAKREEVLRFCAGERLFAPPLLDQATLAAIAQHIVEVCQEWRWM
jgi:predicted nicotinamide N-methyase